MEKSKYNKFNEEIYQKWVRLYVVNRWSTCKIAEKYNCDHTLVNYHLRKHNVKIRSNLGAGVGPKNHMYGKQHTKETKRKISEAQKGHKHSKEAKQKMVGTRKGRGLGIENSNWKGGSSKLPYAPAWTKTLKLKIKARDNFKCQHPDGDCCGSWLHVHHIDYNKMNCNEDNLITLCRKHNAKVNGNRDYWTEYFKRQLKLASNVMLGV